MNYAEHARQLSSAELAAVAKVYTDEQKRRSGVNVQGADPEIAEMLRKEHETMYGANQRAAQIAHERHERLYGLGTF